MALGMGTCNDISWAAAQEVITWEQWQRLKLWYGCVPPLAPIDRAEAAATAGDMVGVIQAAADNYGVDGPHLVAMAGCESGLNPGASSGYYGGLFQHDPGYWPSRSAAYGMGGRSMYDPVANAFTTAGMVATYPHPWTNWPVCWYA